MAELIKVNKKVINDPLFTPVIKFLQDRIAKLEVTGPADELALSKERYDGLVAGDLVIESAITFPDGAVRVCIISRKTGFARVDIDIKQVKMDDILTDFAVPLVEIEDVDHLKTYVKGLATPIQPTLLYLKEKGTYGVLVTQDQAKTHEGPMEAFGNLFFENYVTERESENSIDWETLESGTVTITDPSFGRGIYPLFIYELALSEAQLPEITSNLPASITSRRGESFVIPNTYWFSGTQDITTVATVELSTKSGYAILDRSSNLLEIDGETIYGSATEEINDQIVVRVVYDWNGRLVRKNFYIDLKIEKDLPNDLTITCVPSDVTATSGDTIQVTMTAVYKGKNVEILIPPNALKSQTRRSNLTYVKTNKDFSMVYRGSVNATFPNTVDKLADLASGEFSYNDEGAVLKATGFVNIIIVKPETLPTFSVTGVPNSIQGYIDATGAYKPVIKYGDDIIPLSDITLQTGVQGSKGLIDITAVNNDTGVNWKLIEDSQVPGQSIRDNFTQTYEWLDPRGVVQSKSFVIQVEVKLDSIIKIVPKPPQPRNVQRYQTGGPTWTLEVNGDDRNDLIRSVTVDPIADPDEQYIVNNPKASSQWMVLLASETADVNYTANFTFTAYVDGKTQTFKFSQEFVIAKYVKGTGGGTGPVVTPPVNDDDPSNPGGGPAPGETGTGPGGNTGPVKPIDPNDPSKGYEDDPTAPGGEGNPNSPGTSDDPNDPDSPNGPYNYDITAVPTSFTIGGNSDKNYQLTFKIYEGANDVTANSEIMSDYTLVPENVTFNSVTYNAQKNEYTVAYTKNKGGESTGAIFAKLKNNANPTKKQIARLWIDVNIQQIKILKAIDAPKSIALTVEESKEQPLNIEFSGKKLALDDPNLRIAKQGTGPTKIDSISATALTFLNDTWTYVGTTVTEDGPLLLTYTDPDDNQVYTLTLPFNYRVTYPAMELIYTGSQQIDAKIWDKGTLPIKLQAGNKDFTSSISNVGVVTGSKYVSVNKLAWEAIFAESTATSQIVGVNVYYNVGQSGTKTLPADFKFNLAAWDGITFAVESYTPDNITGKSGDKGELVATFVYKGQDATNTVVFDKAKSTIPNTVIIGTPTYDAARGLVIPYELTLGGDFPMSLVFGAPAGASATVSIDLDTSVEWPNDLNIVTAGKDVRGYWFDTVSYPLVLNYKGTPVSLDDPNLDLTTFSGANEPIQLAQVEEESLDFMLYQGGTLGTSYDYTITISMVYTNQATGETFSKELNIPATIRVPNVKVGANPKITGDVFQTGKIPVTLVDERNGQVPITSYAQSGAGSNVSLWETDSWYIMSGSTTGATSGELPLRLGFVMGGSDHTIDVTEEFTINKWDGIYFKAETKVLKLDGKGGDTGDIPFDFTYVGFPVDGVTLDLSRSKVPSNISIGDLEDDTITYTLSGQDTTTMELCFVRPGAADPMVAGRDYALVDFSVKTQSSNLPFTLVSNDDAITLDWGKTGVVKFAVKYGDNVVPNNAPGLVVKLKDADVHGIAIQSVSKDGITVKATRSDVAGSTKVYPESFLVSYEVGAPEPKTVSFDINATVSMGPAAIINNDKVNVAIWGTGTFRQAIQFNGATLNTIDHFEIRGGVDNKYIEVKGAKGYEVIGAELTTTTQSIPMTVYYTVDGTSVLQKLDFDASFQITGSSSVRFKVNVSPTKIEGSLNNESQITCTPIYKDKPVGGAATFKPDLSTIPKELTLKDYKVVNNNYVITFVGATGGVDTMTLVFWSPDAGTAPKDRDVAKVDVDVKVMGELGIEIGTRDNLITGTNGDTGTYRFQILFGGIPIDAAAEIANGNLTAIREVGATSSMNANVVKIDKWNAASYNYSLVGCVQPNATVNVSDFINLTYKYGGQTFTRRVEIPLKYTSDIPTFGGWPTAALKVFSKSTLSPTAVSGGVSVASGIASISNWGDTDDTYITLGGSAKTYEVIWGEKTEITHLVHARVIGQYRQWTWSAEIDIPFTIAAWDQRTWNPITDIVSWETFLGLNGNALGITINESAQYKAQQYTFASGTNLDLTRSDLGGLITTRYIGLANAARFQQYALSSSKVGQYQGKFCWLRPGAPTPGVENMDYAYSDFAINIKQNSLVADSVARLAGGNNDVVTGPLVIRLNSDKSQVQNTNANLVIATVNEDVFKITSKAASAITVQITAPYTVADGPVDVPMTFKYTDPNTGYVTTGTFDYPITLRRPADWPVVTQTNAATNLRLYDYGPNPFTVKVNNVDVTSQVIPIKCEETLAPPSPSAEIPPFMEMSLNDPVQGNWYWVTKTFSAAQTQLRFSNWTIRVPYRGATVDVVGRFNYYLVGGTSATEFYVGSQQTKFLVMQPGDRITLPFEIKYRLYKYGQAEFLPDYQIPGWTPFSTDFTVISQSYDDSTGLTSLTFEAKNAVARPVPFPFKYKGATDLVLNKNVNYGISSSYQLTLTDLKNNAWAVWDQRSLATLVTIADGSTSLTNQCKIVGVSNPLWTIYNPGSNNTTIQLKSSEAVPAQNVDLKLQIQLPNAYFNAVIEMTLPSTIAEYDGNEFVITLRSAPSWPSAAVGNTRQVSCYFDTYFRGQRVSAGSMATSVRSTTAEYRSVNKDVDGSQGLIYGSIGYVTPSNLVYVAFANTLQMTGKLILPFTYFGAGSTDYPVGTKGKNYTELDIGNAGFYENALYLYPSDKVLTQVEGAYNARVAAPMVFTVGKDFPGNPLNPSSNGMTWVIMGNTMSGVVSKPTTSPSSATGINLQIDYDNRGDDVVVDVPIQMNFNSTYRGVAINSNYNLVQKVLIKGSKTGDTITTTPTVYTNRRVWEVLGPALTIVQNGKTITASQIKDIQIAANPYIRRPETTPNFVGRWFEIYNGKTDGPTDTVATFTVTYNDGIKDVTITRDVAINIQQYSGSPWNVVMTWTQSQANAYALGISAGANAYGYGWLQVQYKLATLTEATAATYAISTANIPTDIPGFVSMVSQGYQYVQSGNTNPGPQFQFTARAGNVDTQTKKNARIKFGFKDKVDDPNSIQGQDWVYVNFETVVWADGNQYYLVSQDVTEYTGKFGDANAKFPFTIRRQNVYTPLNNQSVWTFTNAGNLQPVYNQADQASVVTANFSKELTTAPSQTLDTVMNLGYTQPTYSAKATVRVTQVSNYEFPTISNVNSVNASLNQSGGLPFTIKDSSGNDITSTATMTAIATNDYIKLDSGKWLCYNTRTADTSIQVTFTFTITYKGNLLTMTQAVPFVIKPYTDQPSVSNVQVVNAKVWDIGSALPFTINMSGNPVPASWITGVTGTAANSRVQVTSAAEPWYIVAGSKDGPVSDTVSYTVTVNNGTTTWTVKQDVVFNIAKYDGIELVGKIITSGGGNANTQSVFYPYNATSLVGIIFQLYSKGRLVNSPQSAGGATVGPENTLVLGAASTSGNQLTYTIKGNGNASQNTRTSFTVKIKLNGSAGTTEGIDLLTLTIPVFMVAGTGQLLVHPRTTTAMSGKYGTPVSLAAFIIKYVTDSGSTFVDLTTGSTTVAFAPTDVISLVANSFTPQGYKVNFVNKLYADTVKDVTVTLTNGGVSTKYVLNVTQLASPADQPDVTNNNGQTAGINQTGALPFKLVDPDTQQDVTSTATISSIDSNDYIELVDGKWRVKKDVTANTHSNVTFNLLLNYRNKDIGMAIVVDFLIKPFDGKFVIAAVPDIAANVWDRGTVIPLTISVNGNAMPASWITGYAANPVDQYVTVAADGSWQVVAGNKDAAITETVGYAANVAFPGGTTAQAIAPVKYNIGKYDGVEFKLQINNLNTDGVLLCQAGLTARGSLSGYYRGDIIGGTSGFAYKAMVKNVNLHPTSPVGNVNFSGTAKLYDFTAVDTPAVQAQNVLIFTRPGGKTDDTAVEGIDYAKLVVPISSWKANTVVAGQTPSVFEGKLGDVLDVRANLYYGGTRVALDSPAGGPIITITPDSTLGIEIVSGSIINNGFKLKFTADVSADTSIDSVITYRYQNGSTTGTSTPAFKVVQHPSVIKPDVKATGTMQPVEYGETGQIVLTGTVGSDALAGKVTFVPGSSDAKGLVQFGTPTTGDNGTVTIPVTGIKVGKDNLTIHITVNGATGNTSGKDYLDIIVAAEVTYASMSESEDFQTSGTGYQGTPVTLTQSVILPTDE